MRCHGLFTTLWQLLCSLRSLKTLNFKREKCCVLNPCYESQSWSKTNPSTASDKTVLLIQTYTGIYKGMEIWALTSASFAARTESSSLYEVFGQFGSYWLAHSEYTVLCQVGGWKFNKQIMGQKKPLSVGAWWPAPVISVWENKELQHLQYSHATKYKVSTFPQCTATEENRLASDSAIGIHRALFGAAEQPHSRAAHGLYFKQSKYEGNMLQAGGPWNRLESGGAGVMNGVTAALFERRSVSRSATSMWAL